MATTASCAPIPLRVNPVNSRRYDGLTRRGVVSSSTGTTAGYARAAVHNDEAGRRRRGPDRVVTMSEQAEFRPGLEGVIAFESEIAEPDREGGALRYRGVDINDLVGRVSFGNV